MLRQDPDVIMLGEIRDNETAEIAVKAALTGHLVLSTLHTNSTSDPNTPDTNGNRTSFNCIEPDISYRPTTGSQALPTLSSGSPSLFQTPAGVWASPLQHYWRWAVNTAVQVIMDVRVFTKC